jgi:hypothetical protein
VIPTFREDRFTGLGAIKPARSFVGARCAGENRCVEDKHSVRSAQWDSKSEIRDEGSSNLLCGRRMLVGAGCRLDIVSSVRRRPARLHNCRCSVFWPPAHRPTGPGRWKNFCPFEMAWIAAIRSLLALDLITTPSQPAAVAV